jgi:hypothetical protein
MERTAFSTKLEVDSWYGTETRTGAIFLLAVEQHDHQDHQDEVDGGEVVGH